MNLSEDNHWWFIGRRKLVEKYVKKGKVLEVGCGTGGNIRYFGKIGIKILGLDIKNVEDIRNMVVASAEKMPFEVNKFDTVLMLDVLEHISDDRKALSECFRVVKPDGVVILSVPMYMWMWSKWDEVLGHQRRYQVNQLSELIKRSGFLQIDKFYYYSFLVLPVYVFRKIKEIMNKEKYRSDFTENSFGLSLLASIERKMIELGLRPLWGLSSMWILTKK